MPRTVKSNETASSPAPHAPAPITFPADQHLIITTPGGIFSWDKNGIRRLFNSSKKGILAAREAKDGSQLLAVADKHTVVLHDCKRGREESWGLEGDEGQVRLLEYAPDAKSLFLSTSLTGDIQCYSINESRLLDPASNHPSPPTVLAVSSSSHLMLSASEHPPVVYLQNLTLKTPPMQMHPFASDKAVVAASFHPERPNVFMLAFKDGTLAAYDATKMARRDGVRINAAASLSIDSCAGEIAHFNKLHRITNIRQMEDTQTETHMTAIGSKSVGITGASFLPGYRTRAVSVGADGRCRIVDFESGGRILRTWHAQAPVTSLSVLAIKETSTSTGESKRKSAMKTKTTTMGGPNSTNSIIAVGRVDGQVLLFDSLGLKLDDLVVNELGEKIISVEWMKGKSPGAMSNAVVPSSARKDLNGVDPPAVPWTGRDVTSSLPPALQLPAGAVFAKPSEPGVTIEVMVSDDFATVRHMPGAAISSPAPPAVCSNYLDLFSPVKQTTSPPSRPLGRSPDPSPRLLRRPRLSSQTFVGSSSPELTPKPYRKHVDDCPTTPHQLPGHLSSVVVSAGKKSASPRQGIATISAHRRSPLGGSSKKARKQALVKATTSTGGNLSEVPAAARRNGQVLADLRKLGAGQISQEDKKSSNLALFAPYMNRTGIANLPRTKPVEQHPHQTAAGRHEEHPSSHSKRTQVHFDSESHSSDRDIWLTAGSSDNEHLLHAKKSHTRQKHSHGQPKPEHKPLPSKSHPKTQSKPMSGFSPESTTTVISPQPYAGGKGAEVLSMSDEAMYSAASHFSPLDGGFVPSSNDVRRLFPRDQSLSPSASPKRLPASSPQRMQVWVDGEHKDTHAEETSTTKQVGEGKRLAELQPNAVNAVRRAKGRHEAAKKAAAALLGSTKARREKTSPALPPPSPGNAATIVLPPPAMQAATKKTANGLQNVEAGDGHTADCGSKNCSGCQARDFEVRELKDEVARLKAEVLGLRMQVRRSGVGGEKSMGGIVRGGVGKVGERGGRTVRAVPARRM